ncbi:MAG: 50S ribosomal protein L15 [Patescibacteria group bacterium]
MTELQLHTIKPARGSRRTKKALGRGEGSGKGKTAGRGTKGQRARSGGKARLTLKGLKRIVLRIPKNRGFRSGTPHPTTVTLDQLNSWFENGAHVDLSVMKSKNLIPHNAPGAKIVNTGELKKKLTLTGIFSTPAALEAITKAGGSIEKPPAKPKKQASKKTWKKASKVYPKKSKASR